MIMTVDQAFNAAMNEYPSLITAQSLELTKLKFYDYVFNTIGNGLCSVDDFKRKFKITRKNKHLIGEFPEKYCTPVPLYHAIGGSNLPRLNHFTLYTHEEAQELIRAGYSVYQFNKKSIGVVPYPNFEKAYSLVYKVDLKEYDPSWTIAAIQYYSAMEQWFKSNSACDYLPHATHLKDMQAAIRSYEEAFKYYGNAATTVEERNANISSAYGIPFDGNIEQFIRTRWDSELGRIKEFITETLVMLQRQFANAQ